MIASLRLLLLEDSDNDAELVEELLKEGRFVCGITRVQTRDEYLAALETERIDLILADYKLPSFDGISALKLAQSIRPDLPFIFVSGTLGEELAIEALKIGATDYVLKTRLSRLVPSVERALHEARERAERRQTEEALRRSEMYLAEAQRLSHTGSFGWNVLTGEIYWSDETYRIYEFEPTSKPTVELAVDRTHPEDRDGLRQSLDRIAIERGNEFALEYRLLMNDGTVKYVHAQGHRSMDEGPEHLIYVGAVSDISERKRAEETLREQANLLGLTHDAIFVRDMNGVITYWNRGAETLYGWTAKEAEGQIVSQLLKTVSPVPIEQATGELRNRGHWEGEFLRSRKDGTQVTVASRWSLQRNAQGAPVAALETNNDISHRKRAEEERERLRQREADLARMSRVSMMGELAASLAHEIRQPIAAAVMDANACKRWLLRDTPDFAEACDSASAMVASVTRAVEIIDHVRSLYRRDTPERASVDVNEIVRELTVLLGDTAGRNAVSIRTELDLALPTTTADRIQLQQVLMNLMLNGIEAMKDAGGELTVRSTRAARDELLISVSDSGIGFPMGHAERIFEAFFTTKPQGTGMGLSISRRIIEAHGGRLWASPNKNGGAIFQFALPAGDAIVPAS